MTKREYVSVALAALMLAVAACGNGDGGSELSPEAVEGRKLALSKGCTACHGNNGEGRVGPAWLGLAGGEVQLADGSTVVADDDYLRRSITDPQAQVVASFTVTMPTSVLSDAEIDALVAYIKELQ